VTELTDDRRLTRLSPAAAGLGRALSRPRAIAVACILTLTALGWLYLGVVHAGALVTQGGLWDFVQAICRPSFGASAFGMPGAGAWGAADIALVALMWSAMVLAMMLPTAGPMVLTYAEIADTAARKGETVVSPLVLAGGYVLVWLGFALFAALLQAALTRAALLDPSMRAAGTLFSAEIFIAAGLYQFSALKRACLTRCQRPFPFFFANWSTTARGVFALGLRQGLHCLGCCWAIMLVMLAVGVMNVVWMAALGLVMAAEKLSTTPALSRLIGFVLVALGLYFLLAYVDAYWPAWSIRAET
jgi:predicted metal-binding membrane protein